ncbi:hypothetical protein L1887_58458 [Cichorium endivia]|nr:hypothetical protein L1887_58458 [Cichorium endivia]
MVVAALFTPGPVGQIWAFKLRTPKPKCGAQHRLATTRSVDLHCPLSQVLGLVGFGCRCSPAMSTPNCRVECSLALLRIVAKGASYDQRSSHCDGGATKIQTAHCAELEQECLKARAAERTSTAKGSHRATRHDFASGQAELASARACSVIQLGRTGRMHASLRLCCVRLTGSSASLAACRRPLGPYAGLARIEPAASPPSSAIPFKYLLLAPHPS